MNRPHVTLKLATSLDGRIAIASGESRWITGEAARAEAHRMRAAADAVVIGAGTARADKPTLLARTDPPPQRQPARIVVTTRFDLAVEGALFEGLSAAPLIVFGAEHNAQCAALEAAGARVEHVSIEDGRPSIAAVVERLASLGLDRIMVEGGGALAGSLVAANLIDRLEWFRAPLLLGAEGRPAIGKLALSDLASAPRWRRVAVRALGPDLWESYERT